MTTLLLLDQAIVPDAVIKAPLSCIISRVSFFPVSAQVKSPVVAAGGGLGFVVVAVAVPSELKVI